MPTIDLKTILADGEALVREGADPDGTTVDPAGAAGNITIPVLSSPLYAFHRALALRATAPVTIAFIGDSQFAGLARINGAIAARLATIFNPRQRPLTYNSAHAAGTTSPGDTTFGLGAVTPSAWTSTGAAGLDSADVQAGRGVDGCALQMTNLQAVTSVAIEFDQLTFRWLTPLSGSGATLEFIIDGVSVHTSSAAAAGSYTYDAGSVGTRTITILSHGTTLFNTVDVFKGNHDAWIQPKTAAKTAATTGQIAAFADLPATLTSWAPALTILEPGTNGTPDADTFYTEMGDLIDVVQAATAGSIAIMLMPATLGDTDWIEYRYAAQRLASEEGVHLIELSEAVPDLSASDPNGYTADGVHFNTTKGRNTLAAATIAGLLSGQARDYRSVDAFGVWSALESAWRSLSESSGAPGELRIVDNGQGGITARWFRVPGDTYPVVSLGSQKSLGLHGLLFGAGGSTVPDAGLFRTRAGVVQPNFALGLGQATLSGVHLATTGALPACTYANGTAGVGATLTGDANGQLADIDFATPVAGRRYLIQHQAAPAQNGVYDLTTLGTAGTPFVLTRSLFADEAADYTNGMAILVAAGRYFGGSILITRPATITMGTTAIAWAGQRHTGSNLADTRLGPKRDRRTYDEDFEELDATITVTGTKIPGRPVWVTLAGAGAQVSQREQTSLAPGVANLSTGTTTTGYAGLQLGKFGFVFDSSKRFDFATRFTLPVLTSAADIFGVQVGAMTFIDAATAQTAGMYFDSKNTTGGNWFAVVANASTGLAGTDTGVAVATTASRFAIWYDEVTGTAHFYMVISGVLTEVAAITANIPTVALDTGVRILKAGGSTGTTARELYVDWLYAQHLDPRGLPLVS